MTATPTDKKLSERFAEAMQRGGLLYLAVEHGETIVAALRLAESHPSARDEAVRERERCTICDDIVLIDDERIRQEENHVYGTPGGLEHMGDVWRQISEWAAAIRARGE